MNTRALDGWAITRIPPFTAPLAWSSYRGGVSLVSVSDLVLQEDYVDYVRNDILGDGPLAFKA
ncbi:MAG TPA: hypothetical protein VMW85_01630 [Methanomassiliicoccales archaeon]|nr:hypothetical protein [Methanomassiliicoccales archaeon]